MSDTSTDASRGLRSRKTPPGHENRCGTYRACKSVTIRGVTPRDWSLLGSKRDNWGLVTRIKH